ncbi:MAG: chemotaxis-specific protein-glutamate methyltransferase CheB [Planctomycetota bacterium]|nr:chemotaxis-specific protein-glutamate methyltransferase CheB [Planctomycetota bacterium]
MPNSQVRVMLVDDSPLVLTILRRILGRSPEVKIVGTAAHGREALQRMPELDPQVVCTDLQMPIMDGLQLTQEIMATDPRPILVVSSVVGEENPENVFDLLQAGALDVFPKPHSGNEADYDVIADQLVRKIRILSGVHVIRKRPRKVFHGASPGADRPPVRTAAADGDIRMIVIGASTGGPQAFHAVLSALPADFPIPIVGIQHIGAGFLGGFVKWLVSGCRLSVKVAERHETLQAGTVYFAPEGQHLVFDTNGRIEFDDEADFEGHRPSVTVTMRSAARQFSTAAFGVLLTGMGRDGADGLQEIARAGGSTLVQDQQSCVVFGMPKRAIELGAAQHVLPLEKISLKLKQLCAGQFR